MSLFQAFRRQPVPQQFAQNHKTVTLPAPVKGLVMSENEAYTQPGAALVCDNWVPTLRGVKLRGGFTRWCELPETAPIVSAFEYITAGTSRMFAANASKLYDVTSSIPILVKSGQSSGNYAAAQFSNQGGDWMIVVNDAGDPPLRFNGGAWEILDPTLPTPPENPITGLPGTPVEKGRALTYVWKYRNRLFFIEGDSMNAWHLGINSVGGNLLPIPLAGSATRGGKLLFGATWSMDTGDGTDDRCIFVTHDGEVLVFTGTNPQEATTGPSPWRQEGRYDLGGEPLGMNAHFTVGGDLLIMTTEGIVPLSQAIQKQAGQLELAMVTRAIKPLWRDEVIEKREYPWTAERWDEYGGVFVTTPGGKPGQRYCLIVNSATGAWARLPGIDAQCFIKTNNDCFFCTQDGIVMQFERTGYDDGQPYMATLVGGWEMFQQPSATVVWHQARAVFKSSDRFVPQLSACTDFVIELPPAPEIVPDLDLSEVWDQGDWDEARWDQAGAPRPANRNTMWVSIGATGFTHAPVVQVRVGQQRAPQVELIAIAATFERLGVTV